VADGTIGDAAHAARQSDHNPDSNGVVHAFDLTHDPGHGVDCNRLSEEIRIRKDPRVKYVIWSRRIFDGGVWVWRAYDGVSPHTDHIHVSVLSGTAAENDTRPWYIATTPAKPGTSYPPFPGRLITQPPVMAGNDVKVWQGQMAHRGWKIGVDGKYGPGSEAVCRAFQTQKHLGADGIVGPKTWAAAWTAPVT